MIRNFWKRMIDMKLALDLFENYNNNIQKIGTSTLRDWDSLSKKQRKNKLLFLERLNKLTELCEFYILCSKYI